MATAGLCCTILWLYLAATAQAQVRLPNTVTPTNYDLLLTPNINSKTYTGKVDINIVVSSTASGDLKTLSLHKDKSVVVNDLDIILKSENGSTIAVYISSYSYDTQIYSMILPTALIPGAAYTLSIPFSGTLRSDRTGLHIGSYTYNNEIRYYVAANFYPIYARLAFPCFDEPQFKPNITLKIERASNQFAVSNRKKASSTFYQDVFEPTTEMSIHSLSIFVGDSDSMNSMDTPVTSGTGMTLWKTSGSPVTLGAQPFSLFQALLEKLLGVNHPLGHLNIFVLPDLKYEAYGGYGVIFLREDIVRPYAGDTIKTAINYYLLIFDQLVRQYVRDFVSPAWWSDVWLTEGMTTYLKHLFLFYAADKVNAEQLDKVNAEQLLVVNTRQQGFLLDTKGSFNYPLVEFTIDSSSGILRAVSDDLKKCKGAALMFMIDQTFSGAATVTLIQQYFLKGQHTITTDGFMKSITTSYPGFTGMDGWLNSTGYPIVKVSRKGSNFTLTQEATNGLFSPYVVDPPLWEVPISYTYASHPNSEWTRTVPTVWQNNTVLHLSIEAISSDWIIFNMKSAGFYRVQYDSENLQQILKQLRSNNDRIDVINHAFIVDDIMALSAVGSVNYTTSLKFLKETSLHTRYSVWVSTINALNFIKVGLYNKSGYTKLQTYVKKLLQYPYDSVGLKSEETEGINITMFRSLILPLACEFGVGDCVQQSTALVDTFTTTKGVKAASVYDIDTVLCTGFRNLGSAEFDVLFTYYKTEAHTYPSVQYMLSAGIGCATRNNLNTVLAAILNGEIFAEDVERVFTSLYSLIENVDSMVDFIVNNATSIQQKFGVEFLQRVVKGIGNNLYSEVHVEKLLSLNSTLVPPSVVSEILSVADIAKPRIAWAIKNSEKLSVGLDSANTATGISTHNVFLLCVTLFVTCVFKVSNV